MSDFMDGLSEVRKNMIEDCMTTLGYPVISLFITQEQINRFIDLAVRKCSPKANVMFLQPFLVMSGCVDVADYNMTAVHSVYKGDVISGTGLSSDGCDNCTSCGDALTGCDICEKLCTYRTYSLGLLGNSSTTANLYNILAYQGARSELEHLVVNDYYLDVREGKLYLDGYSGLVTVEYAKGSIVLEDLKNDATWISWVNDYVIALSKITEGRIRGKYKASSGAFEVESDELISEGTSEKQELEEQLKDNIGYWNIMR